MRPRSQNKDLKDPEGHKSLRCVCGSLLARLVADGVELKCRRCKRHIVIPLENDVSEKMETQL